MAFNFVRTSSQYFTQSVSGRSLSPPLTLVTRFKSGDQLVNQVIIAIRNGNDKAMTTIRASDRTNSIVSGGSTAAAEAITTTAYTLNTDGSICGIVEGTNSRTAYLNGGGKNSNTDSYSLSLLNEVSIGARYTSGWAAFMNGDISEAGLWSAVLTDDEIMSLAKGFKPSRIRPQSLVFYAPLIRNTIDLKSPTALTPVNSPTVANHPRVY